MRRNNLFIALIASMALTSCAPRTQAPGPIVAKPPVWAVENCAPTEKGYIFTGYGVGSNVGDSSRRALVDAKKNALLCIIGGQFSYYFESNESYRGGKTQEQSVQESTRVSLRIDDVDWTGFSKILGKHWTNQRPEAGFEIYSQYQWPEAQMKASRAHLDLLVAEIEKNRALENQVAKKDQLIAAQAVQLQSLEEKEQELENLKAQSEEKAAELIKREQELASLKKKIPALERKAQGYEDMADKVSSLMDAIRERDRAISEQRELLREVEAKQREYQRLKSQTQRAVAELNRLKKTQDNRSNRLRPVMNTIYCGTTLDDLVKVLGEWDSCTRDCTQSYFWGEFEVTAFSSKGNRIQYVQDEFGDGKLRKICGRY